jgi:hypothetical protein
MPTNPYFNHETVQSEQNLVEDLVVESIKIYGSDMIYVPRTVVLEDDLFGEDRESAFESGFTIEMYVDNVDEFGGEGDFIAKFGLEIRDEATLSLSKRRFQQVVQHMEHPNEGDLIYWPLTKVLLEIKHVEHENPFYQVGRLYVYKLTCQLFRYAQEDFETGVPEIDEIEPIRAYGQQLIMEPVGGTGKYEIGETVFQGTNFATADAQAKVVAWDPNELVLVLNNVRGLFLEEVIVENEALTASYTVAEGGAPQANVPTDPGADNWQIQQEADEYIDFSEDNPFGDL